MNRVVAIERARAEVAERKGRCSKAFSVDSWAITEVIYGCWNYHHEVQELRHAETRLSQLERGA